MSYDINKSIAWDFLDTHSLGVLATVGENNQPEMAAIYYFIEKDFTCYYVTKEATRKFINTKKRNMATLLVFNEAELMSVEVAGDVEVVSNTTQIVHIVEKFQTLAMTRKVGYWIPPVAQLDAGSYVVCKIVPHTILLNNFSQKVTHEAQVHKISLDSDV